MAFLDQGEDNINASADPHGDLVTASATVHTDGSPVVLIASTAFEASVLVLVIHTGSGGGGQNSSALLDVLIDGVEKVPDVFLGFLGPLNEITIPLFIPAGSEVSCRLRSAISSYQADVGAYLFGGDENDWAPTEYVTYGAVPSSSRGTSFTCGDGVEGSYVSIGTPAVDHDTIGLLLGGGGNGTQNARGVLADVGAGAGTPSVVMPDKAMIVSGDPHTYDAPSFLPVGFPVSAGAELFLRGLSTGSGAGTSTDGVAYGAVGGQGGGGGFEAPANLQAVAQSASQILVTWDAVPSATGYDVERDGVVVKANHPTTSYLDEGLAPSTAYDYRVRALRPT
jgi:hypothetical protein